MWITAYEVDAVNKRVKMRAVDSDGLPVNDLAFDTADLSVFAHRETDAAVEYDSGSSPALADATLSGAHVDAGFKFVGDGWYEFHAPDALFVTGADWVDFWLEHSSVAICEHGHVDITGGDPRASLDDVAQAVLDAAEADPIHSNVKELNDVELTGAGTEGNEWDAA